MKIKTVQYNASALSAHLRGHSVPRDVRQRVREVLDLFRNVPTAVAYENVPQLRTLLNIAAEDPRLTVRQSLVVSKAYLVLFGDGSVLDKQLVKDREAIFADPQGSVNDAWPFIVLGIRDHLSHQNFRFTGRPSDVFSKHYCTTAERTKLRGDDLVSKAANKVLKDVSRFTALPENIRRFHGWKHVFPGIDLVNQPPATLSDSVGSVSFTQEPGMKLRLFASPYLFIQCYLQPLKKCLQHWLATLDEDCHMNQEKGREAVQQQLRNGEVVHCFDLSSATHLFPWTLQARVLRKLNVPQDQFSVLEWAVKGNYHSSKGDFQWKVGQPLGLYPSFFAFSLAHHYLVRGIFLRLGLNPNGGYVILGDDIAIFDDDVAKVYRKMMDRIGCKINMTKSVISDKHGEFAGAYIDRRNIINVGKLRQVSQSNLISAQRQWTSVNPEFKPVIDYVNGNLDPHTSRYVSLAIKSRVIKDVKAHTGLTPNMVIKRCLRYLDGKTSLLSTYDKPISESYIEATCKWLDSLHSRCPQCWDNSYIPYLLNGAHKVIEGFLELLVTAVTDGHSEPIWWRDFCRRTGHDPDGYSHFRTIRIVLLELSKIMHVVKPNRFKEGNFYRMIRKALNRANSMTTVELIDRTNNMAAQLSSTPDICPEYYLVTKSSNGLK
jgi:hypothetical protein